MDFIYLCEKELKNLLQLLCGVGRGLRGRDDGGVGSGDLRQMSEHPIPHGQQYHSCFLRKWKPAFLHPKGETQSLIDLPQG
jgi:hypothetical protein